MLVVQWPLHSRITYLFNHHKENIFQTKSMRWWFLVWVLLRVEKGSVNLTALRGRGDSFQGGGDVDRLAKGRRRDSFEGNIVDQKEDHQKVLGIALLFGVDFKEACLAHDLRVGREIRIGLKRWKSSYWRPITRQTLWKKQKRITLSRHGDWSGRGTTPQPK